MDISTSLFEAIKKDNLQEFSSFIKDNESISLGRFPLLSLCYLYNSKKIIKNYEERLLDVKDYKIVENEPFEIYKKFRTLAGRCLRLYVFNQIVTPIEMLAIKHKDNKVKKLYLNKMYSDYALEKLKTIYKIFGQEIEINNESIKIKNRPLNYYQKYLHKLTIYTSLSFILVGVIIYCIAGFTTGLGNFLKPFYIYNQTQLLNALSSKGNYELKQDIEISDYSYELNFNGTFNGNNNTIYINNLSSLKLINNQYGTIKNLNIVFNKIDKELSKNFSLFCENNFGVIDNVNITCNELTLSINLEDDIKISGYSINNSGTIKNCNLLLNAVIESKGNGECSFSGFVNNNTNIISNCIFKNSSSIEAYETDISGIVGLNDFGAKVIKVKNYATLIQTSKKNKWSPNVSGIALINYSQIVNSFNFADLQVISNNDLEGAEGNVFIGGITAINYADIEKCLNKGDLTVYSKRIMVYLGGISAQTIYHTKDNNIYIPKIKNSGVDFTIDVVTEAEKAYAFIGGIGGYMYGNVTDCFSLAKFKSDYSDKKYNVGSAFGTSYAEVIFSNDIAYMLSDPFIMASNNYILHQDNDMYQLASISVIRRTISGNVLAIIKYDQSYFDDKLYKKATEELIKQQEVYFDEQ